MSATRKCAHLSCKCLIPDGRPFGDFSPGMVWPLSVLKPPSPDEAERLLHRLSDAHPDLAVMVQLWDGRRVALGSSPRVALIFRDRERFQRCIGSADPAEFAEAYINGHLSIDGNIREAVDLVLSLRRIDTGIVRRFFTWASGLAASSRHRRIDDVRDVRAHYDLSDDFFRLFLDDRMVYSCAYFEAPDQSLSVAQERKLDLVCRKLQLQPSDAFLDVGCGWGGLVIWAASHYGVRAHGITLSVHQMEEARRRVKAAGLDRQVTIELAHYADLPAASFDKIASIGMYEHVGLARLPAYFDAVYRALRPGGLFLNHGITLPRTDHARTGGRFIFRHVFPGAEIAGVPQIQIAMEDARFEILDVHGLRPHYALTLRAWHARFARARQQAAALTSDRVARTWDLYLAGCARAFDLGLAAIHQVLGAKTDADGRTAAPLVRQS